MTYPRNQKKLLQQEVSGGRRQQTADGTGLHRMFCSDSLISVLTASCLGLIFVCGGEVTVFYFPSCSFREGRLDPFMVSMVRRDIVGAQ